MGAWKRSKAERQRRSQILRFWRAVEYFSPPKVDPVDPAKKVFAVRANQPLPWEPGFGRLEARRGMVWQHTVYAGIFAVSKVRDILLEAFRASDTEQDLDGRIGGDSAVLCFTVNQDGQLIRSSVTLSSCAWAIGQTLDPGPHSDEWLTGFDEDSKRLLERLLELGDGTIEVERRRSTGVPPGKGLGPVAGLMSRLVVSGAKGGLGAAAGIVGTGLGPVAGVVAAKVIEQAGGELIDTAAARLTDRTSRGSAAAGDSSDSGQVVEQPDEPPAEVGTKVLDVDDLAAITRWIAEQLGIAEVLQPDAIRIKSYQVAERHADEVSGDVFLNSFYADDLERVADAVEAGKAGAALEDYLRDEADLDAMNRFDVRRLPGVVLQNLQPSDMPLGRWLQQSDHPLALSQQFAINRILASLGGDDSRGLYAVNGPPGTGKTTMLRDLIAALVVQRAERLAKLERPEDAFARKPRTWRTEESAGTTYARSLRPLIPELTGFEIVVASSNNGAVENVTLDIPAADAIGEPWKGHADYLAGPAGLALEAPAWGAIAARLGRRKNRWDFVQRFWWGEQSKDKTRTPNATDDHQVQGLQEILRLQGERVSGSSLRAKPETDAVAPLGEQTWTQAVRHFTDARDRVRSLAAERQEIADLLARLAGPDALLSELVARESGARDTLMLLRQEEQRIEGELAGRRGEHTRCQESTSAERAEYDLAVAAARRGVEAVSAAESALHTYDANKPGLLKRLVNRDSIVRWEAGRRLLVANIGLADGRLAELESARAVRHTAVRKAQGELDQALAAITLTDARLTACRQAQAQQLSTASEAGRRVAHRRREREAEQRRLAAAKERWGGSIPGAEWQAAFDDREAMETRERSAPWMDAAFAEARSELFLAALNLHQALLATAPGRMLTNLRAVMDVVGGQAPADLDPATVLAAWQMLFLVVPVVSTTFASMGRMFSQLGSETLGWLFVDEAGQAAPQEVVGALFRARRAVVVGDPQQLEPVVTLPWTGQRRLAGHFAVDRQWAPAGASVQTLADRLSQYGTWLPDSEGEDVWIGSPLRVHRRCDRLMFEISNKIAYDELMVYGVDQDRKDFPLVQRSVWWDVRALPTEEKWNPEEGRALEITLDRIRQRIDEAIRAAKADQSEAAAGEASAKKPRTLSESVFVISPFRDVVRRLGKVTGDLDRRRYGTVHTTQGKEADIVILVLGTGAGQVGSRNWAAHKPNLLNVAVTRAKRRLIVIGDFEAWSRHRYFRDLAEHELIQRWPPVP